jgi:hypothetical protein
VRVLSKNQGPVPLLWGNDSLTAYLEECRSNQLATFVGKSAEVSHLIEIDSIFKSFLENFRDPEPLVPVTFLLQSHSAYRVAVGTIMAGQVYESQALLRLCLEHATYGHYIGSNDERWKTWMGRHDTAQSKKTVRKEFSESNIRRNLKKADENIGAAYEKIYELLIDFGAHPNEKGFSVSSAIRKVPNGDTHIDAIYLHGDGMGLNLGLKRAGQVGHCVLRIGRIMYPQRFSDLGLNEALNQLCKIF